MKLVRPVKRIETARGHHYQDAAKTRVPGVTTILGGGLPKPALINWSANTTAEAAIDNWDSLSQMTPAQRLKFLQGARYAEKDIAAKRGTDIHGIGEALVKGEQVPVPAELEGYAEGYARLLDAFKVEPVHVEFGVVSYKHGYAGTGDLIAWFTIPRVGRKLLLVDLKSNKSGIFAETALQLSAYRYADNLVIDNEDELPMIEVDDCAGIHIRPNGSDLIPITTNESTFRTFLYAAQIAEFDKHGRDLIGAPVPPAVDSTYRLVREESA